MANIHVTAANRYAREVVAGKVPACRWVNLACQRHLSDLADWKNGVGPWEFNAGAGEMVCLFAEMLPHVKGKWAKHQEMIKLQPWQCFILVALFGWMRKKDGRRRFRRAYLRIPRKNGKSVLAAVIGLYMMILDGEHGAEVYSGATSEKQAWEVFRPARLMLEKSPWLVKDAGAEVWAKSLVIPDNASRFEPVIGKPGDGSSPSCAIADEYHEHDTPDLVDTMETGMGAREQPLLLMITTAGYNLAGPCYDQDLEAQKMLDGTAANDDLFAVMYGLDVGDDWTNPAMLSKANPNLGVSVELDWLESQQRQAVLNPAYATRFKTKHLNEWCSAKTAWMSMPLWQLAADPDLKEEEFSGQECVFVLDLASKIDVCAFAKLFKRRIGEHDHYYAFARYYLPEETIQNDPKNAAMYRKWVIQGYLTPTEGAEIDFNQIREDVKAESARYAVREVAYDPWRATQLAHQLMDDGAECVEFAQQVKTMSAPMKELDAAVRSGRFHHDGNPVTAWMMSNVTAKLDAKDNIYPRKEKPHLKIDGAVAIIMGVARLMTHEVPEETIDSTFQVMYA